MSENELASSYWDRRAEPWARRAAQLESVADPYGQPPMQALALSPGERVLDIGCGPGLTTLAMAELVGPKGAAFGVDISPAMIDAATTRAEAAGADNVTFLVADAETAALGTGFDAVYSRFGVMFFADFEAAFANIASALHPGGRIALSVWGPMHVNPWMTVPTMAAMPVLGATLPPPEADQPGPFALADPERMEHLLSRAGFNGVAVEPVEATRDIAKATAQDEVAMLLEIGPLSEAYTAADSATRARAVAAVEEALAPFATETGWSIPGVARCVTAIKG